MLVYNLEKFLKVKSIKILSEKFLSLDKLVRLINRCLCLIEIIPSERIRWKIFVYNKNFRDYQWEKNLERDRKYQSRSTLSVTECLKFTFL
jgi:hypothetical protein